MPLRPRPEDYRPHGPVRPRVLQARGERDGRLYLQARITHDGKRRSISCGWCTPREWDQRAAALVLDLERTPVRVATVATILDLLECWGATVEEDPDRAPATRTAYRTAAQRLARSSLATVAPDGLRPEHVRTYRDGYRGAPSTLRLDLAVLGAALRWGSDEGLCARSQVPRVRVPASAPDRHTPTPGEVAEVVAWLGERAPPWVPLLLRLQLALGARVGEAALLRWADVDWLGRRVILGRYEGARKTGLRAVPLWPTVAEVLTACRERYPTGERVLPVGLSRARHALQGDRHDPAGQVRRSGGGWLYAAQDALGQRRWTSHALRRLAERQARLAGLDVADYARIYGHSPATAIRAYQAPTEADWSDRYHALDPGALPEGEVIPLRRRDQPAGSGGRDGR